MTDVLLSCLRAAAEPTRLRLLALCAEGDITVGDMVQILGQSQPRVSRHLKLLCDAGLIDRFPEGSRVFYRLADESGASGRLARDVADLIPADDAGIALDRARLDEVKRDRAKVADAYFQANAARWNSIRSLHVDESEVELALARAFPDHVGDLLDIGTGTGRMLQLLADRIDRGVGIDTSRDMLAIARANLEADAVRHCHVRHGDMYHLPMAPDSVDAVIIHQVLHYAEAPEAVIAEATRVLRPSGTLLVVDFTPHDHEPLRADHAHRRLGFADREVFDWCTAAGLVANEATHLPGDPLTVAIWKAARPAFATRSMPRRRVRGRRAEPAGR
ncbi:MAG: metalloregulator ArsR/SmtB family transcription factor [Alphaproteobacteria bacterium]